MSDYMINFLVEGLDVRDEQHVSAVYGLPFSAYPSARDDATYITVVAPGVNGVDAAIDAIRAIETMGSPPLRVLALDQDLVAVSDIAFRIERTRQSVRLYVNGTRGPGGFPTPLGVVASGTRVWDWASVNAWLVQAGLRPPDELGLTREEFACVQALLARREGAGQRVVEIPRLKPFQPAAETPVRFDPVDRPYVNRSVPLPEWDFSE